MSAEALGWPVLSIGMPIWRDLIHLQLDSVCLCATEMAASPGHRGVESVGHRADTVEGGWVIVSATIARKLLGLPLDRVSASVKKPD